jgi:hypothetical protein
MSKISIGLIYAVLFAANALAQAPLNKTWQAWWIACPGAAPFGYGVYHFRKAITLERKPERFVVHVSADNRYRFFVNGEFVASGPAQSDLRNWRYETLDLAPHLTAGANTLAAVVWNGGEHRPMAQISHRTGFLVQADSDNEKAANTEKTWRVTADRAYQPVAYRDNDRRLGWQYYVAGALERVDAKLYPWGWEKPGYDDVSWAESEQIDRAAPAGVESHQKWQLVPRPVPVLFERREPSARIARASGATVPAGFLAGRAPIDIAPHTAAIILIDHGRMTTGYPALRVSGGAGSQVRLTYSEALYDAHGRKGNRDEIEGKRPVGVSDVFLPDGGRQREFRPLWVRSFRFLEVAIETADAPLTLDAFEHTLTGYPAERAAAFECDSEAVRKIWETGWRTLALSSQDVLVSDLAWERIPYVGDTQIHALAWLATTGDERLVRQALEQFDASRAPFGLTQSRYPADLEQYTPLYSLVWVNMVHDYWMHRGDAAFVAGMLPGITQVLGWYERQVNDEGMIGPLFHLDFIDSSFDRKLIEGARSDAIHTLYSITPGR